MKRYFLIALLVLNYRSSDLLAQSKKLTAAFYYTSGIVIDRKGNAFVVGKNNKVVRIDSSGVATHFAGNVHGFSGDDDGINGKFNRTTGGIAIDADDNLYVTDNTRIRKITPDGNIITIAGLGTAESRDGDKSTATFLSTEKIAIDGQHTIYLTDLAPGPDWKPGKVTNTGVYYIRKISPAGIVTTIQDGASGPLKIKYPKGLACDASGNLYITSSASHCIKKVAPDGTISTVAGFCDKTILNSVYKPGKTQEAVLTDPAGIAIAPNGDLYFSDGRLNRIIKISAGKVLTVAGSGAINFTGNPAGASTAGEKDGKALEATFDSPAGIAFDQAGNLFIVDGSGKNNSYIRKLTTNNIVQTHCKHAWNPTTQQYEQKN